MKNILLIENDSKIINEIIEGLNHSDFYIDISEDCHKGYELALKNIPQMIVCNKNIFDSDGGDLFNKLRANSFLINVPFVFLLDNNSKKIESKSSLDFLIKKPFSKTEIKKIVDIAFEKTAILLKESEKKLEDLRGSISFSLPHEFFTPLNGILGFSEILIKEVENLDKDEMIQMLKYINKDAQRLKKLTENFLAYAQLEMISKDSSKVNDLRNTYFINPNEIIGSVASQIAKEFEREDDLILEIEDTSIRMGEGYLKKLCQEIIDNAFKFSEKGNQVIINVLANDTSVMLSVLDHGIGMTQEHINSVGAYMQFNRKIYEQQGSGLGLIIAKKIAELHRGDFNIQSIVNDSTKVTIIFDNQ